MRNVQRRNRRLSYDAGLSNRSHPSDGRPVLLAHRPLRLFDAELLGKFGYRYAWAGENLALNNYSLAESPERAVIALMKSPTHAANILAGDFFRIGIGEVTTADGRHLYAMIFLG
jgi:hypothetical protein